MNLRILRKKVECFESDGSFGGSVIPVMKTVDVLQYEEEWKYDNRGAVIYRGKWIDVPIVEEEEEDE